MHIASGDGWGGAEQVIALLAEGVSRMPNNTVEALLFNEGRLAATLRAQGIPVHVISEAEHSFVRLAAAARAWVKQRDPDVLHAHRYKDILVASMAVLASRRALVITVHGLEPRAQLSSRRAAMIWSTLLVARACGASFVGVSSELAARLKRVLGSSRILQIPNPMPEIDATAVVPDLRSRFGWPSSRPLVGFVGRLEPVKGPDILLDVAERFASDAAFVFIGSGGMETQLVGDASAHGLMDRLAFLGETPNAARYIRQFDALALPSRHEGLPLVVLEAAASEVPVVAFDVGGVRHVRGDDHTALHLVPPMDVDRFRETLEDVLRDRALSRRQATDWAAFVRARFGLSAIAARYCDVYAMTAYPSHEK